VHKDLKSLPDFTTLYRRYLKQRWDVYDLDFTQDKIDWTERMTEAERHSFLAIASGSITASGRLRSSCRCS